MMANDLREENVNFEDKTKKKDIRFVHYQRKDEYIKKAAIVKVKFNPDGLTDDEVSVLFHLGRAAEMMNKIFIDQSDPNQLQLIDFADRLNELCSEDERNILTDFKAALLMQNCPYDSISRKTLLLGLDEHRVLEIIDGNSEMNELHSSVRGYLYGEKERHKFANFYPHDMTDEEFESLSEMKGHVNSVVRRDESGRLTAIENERYYSETLAPVIAEFENAFKYAKDETLKDYISAKIAELKEGSYENRVKADEKMILNSSKIGFILSTATEVYMDHAYNIRGAASGHIFIKDEKYAELMDRMIALIPGLEKEAPWKLKRDEFDESKLPKMAYVNVYAESGDYISLPSKTIAQSLPNEYEVKDKYGTVNYIYKNSVEAMQEVSKGLAGKEFLPKAVFEKFKDMFKEVALLHYATHELGHTTGRIADEFKTLKPGELLKDGLYSNFEECRAELFSLFMMPRMVDAGIITEDQLHAGYHSFSLGLVLGLVNEPTQAHTVARNMIYHFFKDKGVIVQIDEDSKKKFCADTDRMHTVVSEMLGIVGDLKSFARNDEAKEFRKKYCFLDDLKEEIEERTKEFPQGSGLIFPRFEFLDGKVFRNMNYPSDYESQGVFNHHL